jgi:IS30 family transposase
VVLAEAARTGRYLSLLERQRIASLRGRGHGVREIARRLGRSPSTVSRELRCNLRPHDHESTTLTWPTPAAGSGPAARATLARPRDAGLRAVVQAKLELERSPQQVAAHLHATYPDRPDWHLSHETIYQALYHGGRAG